MTRQASISTDTSASHPLPVHTRRTLEAGGTERIQLSVFCPSVRGSTSVTECLRCARCGGVSVSDGVPSEVLCTRASDAPGSGFDAIAALRAPLYRAVAAEVTCIRANAPRRIAEDAISARSLDAIVVVDADDNPLGCVPACALVGRNAAGDARIGFDCVGPRGGVAEDAAVVFAIGWIAQTALPIAPVVSASGALVAAFTGGDLARYLGATEGFGASAGAGG